jgi:hypothetical protein
VAAERRATVFAVFEQMGRYHPHEPHWYLPLIGVDPAHQPKGYGSALLRQALASVTGTMPRPTSNRRIPRTFPCTSDTGFACWPPFRWSRHQRSSRCSDRPSDSQRPPGAGSGDGGCSRLRNAKGEWAVRACYSPSSGYAPRQKSGPVEGLSHRRRRLARFRRWLRRRVAAPP